MQWDYRAAGCLGLWRARRRRRAAALQPDARPRARRPHLAGFLPDDWAATVSQAKPVFYECRLEGNPWVIGTIPPAWAAAGGFFYDHTAQDIVM